MDVVISYDYSSCCFCPYHYFSLIVFSSIAFNVSIAFTAIFSVVVFTYNLSLVSISFRVIF